MDPSLLVHEWEARWQAVSAIATVGAVLVALFGREFTKFLFRPKLRMVAALDPPACHRTTTTVLPMRLQIPTYFLRLWVENYGSSAAENVQVFASRLFRERAANGDFEQIRTFAPMNLRWTHAELGHQVFAERINPGMGRHCDLACIYEPAQAQHVQATLTGVPAGSPVLCWALEVPPATKSHLSPPGKYHLELKIAGSNVRPITRIVEVTLKDEWHQDEQKMLADALGLKEVRKLGRA
jgi:hypothetical protein